MDEEDFVDLMDEVAFILERVDRDSASQEELLAAVREALGRISSAYEEEEDAEEEEEEEEDDEEEEEEEVPEMEEL